MLIIEEKLVLLSPVPQLTSYLKKTSLVQTVSFSFFSEKCSDSNYFPFVIATQAYRLSSRGVKNKIASDDSDYLDISRERETKKDIRMKAAAVKCMVRVRPLSTKEKNEGKRCYGEISSKGFSF